MRTAILYAIALLGCGGSNNDATQSADTSADGGAEAADPAPADASAPPPRTDGGGRSHDAGAVDAALLDAGACGDRATAAQCMQCCADENPGANDTQIKALVACACKTDRCATVCATSLCASMPMPPSADAGDPCTACLHGVLSPDAGAAGCMSDVSSACMADPTCNAFQACTQACGGKP